MKNLVGKVALVTGGSRGIGAATARLLAERGADVALTYRGNKEMAEALVDELRDAGCKAEAFRADVTRAEDIRKLAADVVARFERIDVLVNNAGVFLLRPLMQVDAALFDELFHTNVLGPLQLIQACMPHLPPSGGRIINIISSLAAEPSGVNGTYGATKAALRALTQALAPEVGERGATINAIAPGIIITDMTKDLPHEVLDMVVRESAVGRQGQPEDIAKLVAFLASDDSAWLSGRTLFADGGRLTI